ncbi:four helix bundle protein [Kosmotoga pacifica]|uniref:30S ribosomal protein S23 n=1 Tax=Kosmotoga pacifica TaxID=1330330 RepID=A0A0G2Z4Z8_9BACT|nr:four helix bundle protein [Kosmotoga pacifica]AKI96627.1 hypothetical protein IX53_00975 [Kosmotoga pacifica]
MSKLRFRDLEVWKSSVALVVKVYEITHEFLKSKQYGLTLQLQRAAVSISSYIVEGSGKGTKKDFAHFLDQARGSLYEIITQLKVCGSIGMGDPEKIKAVQYEYEILTIRINSLIKTMKTKKSIADDGYS